MLTDFGELRDDDIDSDGNSTGRVNDEWVMPDLYRAPEVLLKIPWTFQIDMWSVGVMVASNLNPPTPAYLPTKYCIERAKLTRRYGCRHSSS